VTQVLGKIGGRSTSPAAVQVKKSLTVTWDNELGPKRPHTIHLLLQNIGVIELQSGGSTKLAALHTFLAESQVDLAALTECNAN